MDCLTPEQRKKAMLSNKSKETKIEILLRSALWKRGIRYRKNVKDVVGVPDIAIKNISWRYFVTEIFGMVKEMFLNAKNIGKIKFKEIKKEIWK